MFLFLSKLLPLFFYPLGLACLLMLVALVVMWKRPRLAAGSIAVALVLLLVGSSDWARDGLVRSLEWQYIPDGELPAAEAIVVLGGATKSALPPRPSVDLSEAGDRVLYGAQLYREGKAPWVILSGGRIDWRGSGASESADMAEIMETLGVPKSAMLQDPTSLNTYQNAVNVKRILDEKKIRRVLLVTSAIHMPRSLLIFKRQGIEAIPAPTDFSMVQYEDDSNSIEQFWLDLIPDAERLQHTSRALKEYIGLVVYRLKGWL